MKRKLREFQWSLNENNTCVPDTPGGPLFEGQLLEPAEELGLNKALSYGLFNTGEWKVPKGSPYDTWLQMLEAEGSNRDVITWDNPFGSVTSLVYTLEASGWLAQHTPMEDRQWISCSE